MSVVDAKPDLFDAPFVRFYPERSDPGIGMLDTAGEIAIGVLKRATSRVTEPATDYFSLIRVLRIGRRLELLDDDALDAAIVKARFQLRRGGLVSANVCLGIAIAREVSYRELRLRQRNVQIRGARAMLSGKLIEMDTGEGKTITAGLAAATAALAGVPTHVITVNNYLASRDAETLRPVFDRLRVRVGVILEGQSPAERRAAYQSEITYGSNTEIAFDYLRDRLHFGPEGPLGLNLRLGRLTKDKTTMNQPTMRGLHFAIVDEADSVLVDEARTPLIISRQSDPDEEASWANRALSLAHALEKGRDFQLLGEERRVRLTTRGRETLAKMVEQDQGIWESPIRREEVLHQALSALFIFKRGEHYLVHEGKVQIVDEYTGRLQPDRSWSDGMHQLVEAKEEVEITAQNLALARMTYQRFFRRYLTLAGMTGTAREVRGELLSVYGLRTQRIPPHKRSRLHYRLARIYKTTVAKWQAVVHDTRGEVGKGRPVLIGTRSVAASQTVSKALTDAGIDHSVLNAENDSEEADIIACAGECGRVTVATNMAGRGVDITLSQSVAKAGGLHVILTERHDASRIDRQLAGRAGRRGEAGSVSTILSLEDPLLDVLTAPLMRAVARLPLITLWLRIRLFDRAQRRAERSHARMRKDLVRQDRRLNQLLSFTGGLE